MEVNMIDLEMYDYIPEKICIFCNNPVVKTPVPSAYFCVRYNTHISGWMIKTEKEFIPLRNRRIIHPVIKVNIYK